MNHEFDLHSIPPTCLGCGVMFGEIAGMTLDEYTDGHLEVTVPAKVPCTGNAYICRVARKIPPIVRYFVTPAGGEPMTRHFYRFKEPWEMSPQDLRVCIEAGLLESEKTAGVFGLLAAIPDSPGVLPVLADALEEAGCTDEKLLVALRTP